MKYVYIYQLIVPIDFWEGWQTIPEFITGLNKPEKLENFFRFFYSAQEWLRHHTHWEGDVRHRWEITVVPAFECDSPAKILAAKQENNGNTYLVSECKLPWFAKEELVASFMRDHSCRSDDLDINGHTISFEETPKMAQN